MLSGAPGQAPDFDLLLDQARRYGWAGAALSAAVVAVGAIMLEPLELASIRLLEGYWSAFGPLRRMAGFGRSVQRHRRDRLRFLYETAAYWGRDTTELEGLLQAFPSGDNLLPTALGNRLRAFEERAGRAYGFQAIVLWPRLYYVLPEPVLAYVGRCRNQLDTASRLCLTFLVSVPATGVLIARYPIWWLLPAGLTAASVLAYRATLAAADNYGVAVRAAIDVHRLRLLQEMRVEMPPDTAAERAVNERLASLWAGSTSAVVPYAPADNDVAILLKDLRQKQP